MKLTFIADTHHYSKTLGTTGKAYELRSGSDQKCLAETSEIINSAFEQSGRHDYISGNYISFEKGRPVIKYRVYAI